MIICYSMVIKISTAEGHTTWVKYSFKKWKHRTRIRPGRTNVPAEFDTVYHVHCNKIWHCVSYSLQQN